MKGSISVFSLVAVLAVSSCVFAVKQTFTVTDNCTAGCTTGAPPTPAAESTHSGRPEGGDVSFMNIFNDPLSATDVCCPVDRDLDCPSSVPAAHDERETTGSRDSCDALNRDGTSSAPVNNCAETETKTPPHRLYIDALFSASSTPLFYLSPTTRFGMPSVATLFLAAGACLVFYALLQAFSPLVAIYKHHRAAQAVGLPVKILPVPPGVFPFFAFQIIKRLGLATPGGAVEKMFNVGRADGFGMHGELGDTFLTVSTIGIGLVTADPKVASYVSARKEQFPKPPNTGALINLYGKNVINTRGEQWRIHRKVAGPVFSEKIHRDVWNEATRQAGYLLRAWNARSNSDEFVLTQLEDDALRLGMHVITGAAYGVPLGWDQNPPSATKTSMSYRRSLEQLTAYLMPLFLTPRWALRLAPRWTTWGQAWEAYSAFGGYMLGMLELARQKREKNEEPEEGDNLMTVLTRAELSQELDPTEVLGNAFIFLFAGHETTANTLHYALLLLTLHPEIQALVHSEIDELYGSRTSLVYDDFPRMRWVMAVMNETLRVFAPTAMVNKWTDEPTAIPYGRTTVVLPPNTRVSTNITGIHSNPAVWGPDAKVWRPARWIVSTPTTHFILPSAPPSPSLHVDFGAASLLTPTPAASRPSTPGLGAPDLLKPAKGTFLPFSEGSRMCSGRKFAAVEFCAVLCTLLKEHRLEMPRDWSEERMWGVVRGRKPGALTLQPPEPVPIVMVPRRR